MDTVVDEKLKINNSLHTTSRIASRIRVAKNTLPNQIKYKVKISSGGIYV